LRLLVTGGAGFIGSNFVRLVLDQHPGYEVVNLDKLTYAGNLENLAGPGERVPASAVHGDICDPSVVNRILSRGVDAVVNFAAESHVDRSILDASEFVRSNILGTLNLLDCARRNRTARFIQISTDEVYGALDHPVRSPESSPLAPNSPYAASKASQISWSAATATRTGFRRLSPAARTTTVHTSFPRS